MKLLGKKSRFNVEITEKAKKFAIMAHFGQVRKSEKDKPMIIHPIDVAYILKKIWV